jgi:hypothetical protein
MGTALFIILKILPETAQFGFEIVILGLEFFHGVDHGEMDGSRVESVVTVLLFTDGFWEVGQDFLRYQTHELAV